MKLETAVLAGFYRFGSRTGSAKKTQVDINLIGYLE